MADAVSREIARPSRGGAGRRRSRLPLLTLSARSQISVGQSSAILAASVLVGLAISACFLIAAGVPAGDLGDEFIVGTLLDGQNMQAVLVQAAPLMLVGVGAALAFRVNFWNLGLEGQMIFGGLGATAISLGEVGPAETRLPLMIASGIVAGVAWVALALWLKRDRHVNEIIATLLLNYIAYYLLLHLLYGAWKDPTSSFPNSPLYQPFERLPDLPGGISLALPIALCCGGAAWWLVTRARIGLYMKTLNANPAMAFATGVPVRLAETIAVLVSGSFTGLAGVLLLTGQEGRLTQSFHEGYGFSGILIAFLARNNPAAAVIVAVLVAILFVTGQSLQVFYQVPLSMVQLIEALMVIAVASSDFLMRYRIGVRPRLTSGAGG